MTDPQVSPAPIANSMESVGPGQYTFHLSRSRDLARDHVSVRRNFWLGLSIDEERRFGSVTEVRDEIPLFIARDRGV